MITGNTSIGYDVHGEGTPLILINSLRFGRSAWLKQTPSFSRRINTMTFDMRGERDPRNGVADLIADMVALLEQLAIGKAHILVTSLGGYGALELTQERPDLVLPNKAAERWATDLRKLAPQALRLPLHKGLRGQLENMIPELWGLLLVLWTCYLITIVLLVVLWGLEAFGTL